MNKPQSVRVTHRAPLDLKRHETATRQLINDNPPIVRQTSDELGGSFVPVPVDVPADPVVNEHVALQMSLREREDAILNNDHSAHPHLYGNRKRYRDNVLWGKAMASLAPQEYDTIQRAYDARCQPSPVEAHAPQSGEPPQQA